MRFSVNVTCCLVMLLAGACASSGAPSDEQFTEDAVAVLPLSDQTPLLTSLAAWFPNRIGYGSSPEPPQHGLFVITNASVFFVVHGDGKDKYRVAYRHDVSEINSVQVMSFGLGRRLVLVDRDNGAASFELNKAGGDSVDRAATVKSAALLRNAGIGRAREMTGSDKTEPAAM